MLLVEGAIGLPDGEDQVEEYSMAVWYGPALGIGSGTHEIKTSVIRAGTETPCPAPSCRATKQSVVEVPHAEVAFARLCLQTHPVEDADPARMGTDQRRRLQRARVGPTTPTRATARACK